MSTPLTPTSPKAADAGLPGAERKYAETPAATKPAVDTIDAGAKGSSEGVLACLQSLACSVWSCLAGFFTWAISFVYNPPNPELLKDPLKQIDQVFFWSLHNGPIKTMIEEMRKANPFSTFGLKISLECHIHGDETNQIAYHHSFGTTKVIGTFTGRQLEDVRDVFKPEFERFVKAVQKKFEEAENYIDFSRGDIVKMQMQGTLNDATEKKRVELTQYWIDGKAQPIDIDVST